MVFSEIEHSTMNQTLKLLRKIEIHSSNLSVAHAYVSEIIRSFNWETMSYDDAMKGAEIVREAIEIFHKLKSWQPERKTKHD